MPNTNASDNALFRAWNSARDPVIEGTDGDDLLLGTASSDILIGRAGNDTLAGGDGFDVMSGGPGDDWLHGAAGVDVAIYGGSRADYDFTVVGGTVTEVTDLRDGSPDGFDRLTGTETVIFGRETVFGSFLSTDRADGPQAAPAAMGLTVAVAASTAGTGWLVDQAFYLEQNADVAAAVQAGQFVNAQAHWETYGQFEGRAPNALFNAGYYLSTNADLKAAFGADASAALTHWLTYGLREGRDASPLFDSEAYLAANQDVAAANMPAVEHYMLYGYVEGRAALADMAWFGLV
ncbi:calcium-binding protein [Niveispirillum cyanobacteriorum]|uniref:calcium-binding protein n=1 Tax=Niveispirillum cyanobacteriorum TaxID=1612173 RepID=UPI001319E88D|nr:hypothetical protein [Niveispirillum cyanobacteriorum]GGE81063.1 hypothetical protein GCM10011317_42820 [Niveispirillum cyanobacteriorum]